ncbi:MAG: aryl-sulfate sulfotransferase [Haloferacaceae archaeon]
MREHLGDRTVVRILLLALVLAPLLGVGLLSAAEVRGSEAARLPDQAAKPFAERSPVVPPRNDTLVVTGHGFGSDRGAITAFAPDGRLRYYDDARSDYFDVDPSPAGSRTVLYVAEAAYEGEGECDGCEVSVVERANLTTGEVTTLHRSVTTLTWHDVDRINRTHYLVADMDRDAAFVLNVSSGLVVWEWRAQSAFPVHTGGAYPEDWTHINDVTWLNGTVMVSVRNQDRVVFVRPDGTVNRSRTLGCEDCHDVLYEQHNPDYIPAERGGPAVVVADSENDRVVEYARTNGSWERTWVWTDRRLSWPRDADRLPGGRTLITDTHGGRVFVVNRTGAVVWATTLVNGYDAELLSTGDESAGGTSAAALGYRSRSGAGETVFAGSVLETVLPARVRHAVEFLAPWHWDLTDLLLIGVSGAFLLGWGAIEGYWAVGRARARLDGDA